MRVCFLDESFFWRGTDAVNGARVQILALARELRARGHEVAVFSGTASATTVGVSQDGQGIPVYTFRRSARLPVLGAVTASRAVRQYAPELIYVRGRTYLCGVAAWERRRRGTAFVWASNAEEGCELWKHLSHLWRGQRTLLRKLLRTPSDFMADLLCDWGVGHADRHVCQTQHQCARLQAVHHREGVIIRSLQTPPLDVPPRAVPPLVVWVGRVSVERGPETFVQLAASLADNDCDFALVGPASTPGYLDEVLAAAEGLTRFRYVGQVSLRESWDWIARSTLLVNTSPVEGISNALVQAWHCGVPTVVLHFDPDGIVEKNRVGFLSGDPETMVDGVRRLLNDSELRDAMSVQALALARRDFSAEAVGTAYEQVMQQAVAVHV